MSDLSSIVFLFVSAKFHSAVDNCLQEILYSVSLPRSSKRLCHRLDRQKTGLFWCRRVGVWTDERVRAAVVKLLREHTQSELASLSPLSQVLSNKWLHTFTIVQWVFLFKIQMYGYLALHIFSVPNFVQTIDCWILLLHFRLCFTETDVCTEIPVLASSGV